MHTTNLPKSSLYLSVFSPNFTPRFGFIRGSVTINAKQFAAQKKAGIKVIDLGPGFAEAAEEIYWSDLAKGDPEFVKKIRPLLK